MRGLIYGLMVAVALALLTACGGGGADNDTRITNTTVSKGQALIDLKKAFDSGAMSETEYNRERTKLLNAP